MNKFLFVGGLADGERREVENELPTIQVSIHDPNRKIDTKKIALVSEKFAPVDMYTLRPICFDDGKGYRNTIYLYAHPSLNDEQVFARLIEHYHPAAK